MRRIAIDRRVGGQRGFGVQKRSAGVTEVVVKPLMPARGHVDEKGIVQAGGLAGGEVSKLVRDREDVGSGDAAEYDGGEHRSGQGGGAPLGRPEQSEKEEEQN